MHLDLSRIPSSQVRRSIKMVSYTIYIFLACLYCSVDGKIVTINDGRINGTVWRARAGNLFNAFLGIPYAKPPVGNLRFKPPEKPVPWKGVLNATATATACIQVRQTDGTLYGSEDCLNLNVYSPLKAKKGDKIPVIFYIFGGAFNNGDSLQNGPQYFMKQDIIMIQANTRTGLLGFLSTGDNVIPGNFGLKDQNFAMKWTQENIAEFGGDPDKVTLMGHSSGAACAHLHTYSPMSKGLFQKVILQSCAGDGSMTLYEPDSARGLARMVAKLLGCNTQSSTTIYNCVMKIKADELARIQQNLTIWDMDPEAVPKPVVEGKDVKNPFLAANPHTMKYQSPDQPWLMGLTSEESAYKAARLLSAGGTRAKIVNDQYRFLFPIIIQYYWNMKKKDLNSTSDAIRKFYFKDKPIGANTSKQLVQFLSQGMFGFPIIDAIKGYPGPRYAYVYSYRSNYTAETQNYLGYYPEDLGVSHTAEIQIMFQRNESYRLLTTRDHIFGDEMITRWVNFASTGNPNYPLKINTKLMSTWKPVVTNDTEFLRINVNGTMDTNLYKNQYDFWKSIPFWNKYF